MLERFPFAFVVFSLLASLIFAVPVNARVQKGKSKSAHEAHEKGDGAAVAIDIRVFGEIQETIIRDWFSNQKNLGNLPPGLANRGQLPAGLERQMLENGSLPPGLEKHLHPLPLDLEHLLPDLPEGVVRVIIGVDIVLLDKTSNLILDIVREVFF